MKPLIAITSLILSIGLSLPVPALAASFPISFPTAPTYEASQPVQQAPDSILLAYTPPAGLSSPQAILNRLMSANKVPSEINPVLVIEESNTLNAATDGQRLLITTGLLSKLKTDDEQAFIISHELAHILLNHIGKTQIRRVGLGLLQNLFVRRYTQEGSLAQLASELGIGLVDKHSSRGYEYQADDLGVKLMSQAGYNPHAAIQVFETLKAATPGNRVPEFLQTHPISDSRIRALVQKYKL